MTHVRNGLALTRKSLLAALGAIVAATSFLSTPVTAEDLLKKVTDVPLPGGTSRFDYQSLDSASGRLFISHMRDDELVIFDTRKNQVQAHIPGFSTVTGVLYIPSLRRLYASAAGSGELVVFDPDKLAIIRKIPIGRFPDGIAYASDFDKIFVSDESGGQDVVVDPKSSEVVAKIPLSGDVGNTQYDAKKKQILVTVGATNELVVINPGTYEVVTRLSISGADGPHGLYVDSERQLAFVACEGNAKLFVVDLATMKQVSEFPVGEGPDVLAFDTALKRLYVASESGTLSIFDEKNDGLVKRDDLLIENNAHSVAVDSASHRLYFPLKNVSGRPVLRIMEARLP